MTPIKDLKSFLKNRLLEVDADFEEWTDAFNIDNIPSTIKNKTFHFSPGVLRSQSPNDQTVEDAINPVINLFFKGYRTPQDTLIEGYDLAHSYRLNCLDPAKLYGQKNLKSLFVNGITPETVESNDSLVIMQVEFEALQIFKTV